MYNKSKICTEQVKKEYETYINLQESIWKTRQNKIVNLKRYITEALGVADEVSQMAREVVEQINEHASFQKYTLTSDKRFYVKRGITHMNVFGKNYFQIIYKDIIPLSEEIYISSETSINLYQHKMTVTVNRSNMDETYNAIYHELEHYYEFTKGNQKNPFKSLNDNEFYNRAVDYMLNGSECEQHIGQIIYISYKFERTAAANGLYGYLEYLINQGKIKTKNDIVNATKRNETYELVNHIEQAKQYLITNKNSEEVKTAILNISNKPFDWYIKQCNVIKNDLCKRIGKVIVRAFQHFEEVKKKTIENNE